MRHLKVISTAKYLPTKIVTSEEMDKKLGVETGWVEKKSGVKSRHFVDGETSPEMGAKVVREALEKAGLKFEDLDALISTSGTQAQEIPSTSSLVQEQLGQLNSGIPSFDINSTCLSFVTGLDMISYAIEAGRFKRVAFVATEVASCGLNYAEKESASLMGDGAVCVIVEKDDSQQSGIITSHMETYASGVHDAEIRGGGSSLHPFNNPNAKEEDFYFKMNGPRIFKLASKLILPFCDRLFAGQKINMDDIKLVIPHQASLLALRLIQKKLKLSDERFMIFVHNHGNQIAASVPTGIHNAIESGRLKRGDKTLLLGTSAGFSIGGMILTY